MAGRNAYFNLVKSTGTKPDVRHAAVQLDGAFHGQRRDFDLPLSIQGPAFSQKVWQELRAIPFGETRSYAEVALAIGQPVEVIGQWDKPIAVIHYRLLSLATGLSEKMGTDRIHWKTTTWHERVFAGVGTDIQVINFQDSSNFLSTAISQVKGINKPNGNIMIGFFKVSNLITSITFDGTSVKVIVITVIGRING